MAYKRNGFTLIEVGFAMSLLGILSLVAISSVPNALARAKDARAKDQLQRYKVVLEDYNNDAQCYPPETDLATCGGTSLHPYLPNILCSENRPYAYYRSPNCRCYAMFTNLKAKDDPDIEKVGCKDGCGPGDAYNYGISNVKLE